MIDLPHYIRSKILDPHFKERVLPEHAISGKKIVFTNGCFDILHAGHIYILSRASEMGDLLVVGLNTDRSVRRIKGERRPVNDQESRQALLASIEFVDYVILFDEDTPEKLIRALQPDILVKGGDYLKHEIAGSGFVESYGGKVITVPLLEGFSTTGMIEKSTGKKSV